MTGPIYFDGEGRSNTIREDITRDESPGQRTYTPTLAVIERASGLFCYTPEGRRLADFTSGVLVTNLGHHPPRWFQRLKRYMRWDEEGAACPWTAYNAVSTLEHEANRRLLASLQRTPMGRRLEQVLWSASGSEGIQKALWACQHYQPTKDIILATRDGFHGKKGLAHAVTGNENDPDRDPRVRFISFPKEECRHVTQQAIPPDLHRYREELDVLARQYPGRLNCLVTEPYLGGGGSFHPHPSYLKMLVDFCRQHGLVMILDEVQSNFGRTSAMYAFESYGIEPDIVVLGKGMGNGIPVNAVVGRREVLSSLTYGGASDTWSGHPLGCAATLATLDEFEEGRVVEKSAAASRVLGEKLTSLASLPAVSAVRGEGFVWGIEMADLGEIPASRVAVEIVRQAYLGDVAGNAIHLLGPLAGRVIRVSPPITMTESEAAFWGDVLYRLMEDLPNHLIG
jgi:4-aminobutyrate aminotransferase-like enzyme